MSACVNSFWLSTCRQSTARGRCRVAPSLTDEGEFWGKLLTGFSDSGFAAESCDANAQISPVRGAEMLIQFGRHSVGDYGHSRAINGVGALRENGACCMAFSIPAHEIDLAYRSAQSSKKRSGRGVGELCAPARASPDRCHDQEQKTLRTSGTCALNDEEVPERGFVVGFTNLSAAKSHMDRY
jgi:hypothetical protein